MTPFIILLIFLILFTSPVAVESGELFPKEALPTKSGYLPITTASSSNSSLYFTFYEAQTPSSSSLSETPLLIWLQGGPGCSSMVGNFFEVGPYLVSPENPTLHPNPFSWNRLFGLLFIDNPIGSGFSIAAAPADIPRDQPTIAAHLFSALQSFLSSSGPSFRARPLYIAGESYGGKYVPAFSHHILQHNPLLPERSRVNLRGVTIGNGLTHPVVQVGTHADSAYFTGLIDAKQRAHLERLQDEAVRLANQGSWAAAADVRNSALDWLQNATGLATLMDLRRKRPYESGSLVGALLNRAEVKEALGAERELVWEECSGAVGMALHEDVMKSVKWMLEEVLRSGVRVLLYQGMFDLKDGVVSVEAWMREMEWEGMGRFMEAERKVWEVVVGEVAGYVQRWGRLSHVVVGGAGHLVPADQGRSSQAMIEDWVLENGLFHHHEDEAEDGDGAVINWDSVQAPRKVL